MIVSIVTTMILIIVVSLTVIAVMLRTTGVFRMRK